MRNVIEELNIDISRAILFIFLSVNLIFEYDHELFLDFFLKIFKNQEFIVPLNAFAEMILNQ